MGQFVNSTAMSIGVWSIATLVVIVDLFAMRELVSAHWLHISAGTLFLLLLALTLYLAFIAYLLLHGWETATGRRVVPVLREREEDEEEKECLVVQGEALRASALHANASLSSSPVKWTEMAERDRDMS